jgi:hypothetical protein
MPSASPKQQFQPPIQLKILKRVLKTVRAANSVAGDSADINKAARLKPKFQNDKEADLMTAVTDDSVRRSAAAIRSDRLKANALGRWEDDGGSPAMHHAIKGPHQ